MKPKILIIIFIQLIVIVSLFLKIRSEKNNTLGASVNTINASDITRNRSHDLKYFYEPKADSTQVGEASWLPYKVKYTINSDTLNERFDYSVNKPTTTYRIITLGDSFTFGQYINTPENYPETLENLLNNSLECKKIDKFEVINLGVLGYDIGYEVARYKLRGEKYKPDLILWMLEQGNFTTLQEYLQPKAVSIEQELKKTGEDERLIKNGNYYPAWNKAREEILNELGIDSILEIQYEFMNEFAQNYKNSLIIFGYPNDERFRDMIIKFVSSRPKSYYYNDFIDIYKINDAVLQDGHPSALGAKFIAQDLFKYLTKNKFIPCD